MFEAVNLSCVRDERTLFSDLSFTIEPGDMVQIEGQNGAGKTSLLRILAGLSSPDSGEVRWKGENTRRQRDLFHTDMERLRDIAEQKDQHEEIESIKRPA